MHLALTLEHLEAAFYEEGLSKLDEKAFEDAGYPAWVRARFLQIQQHESTHVDFLKQALGAQAVQPCTSLTLEHLEAAFYEEGLSKLDEKAFEDAGYPAWVRARFLQIQQHESTHVDFLKQALGAQAVQPCTSL